TRDASFYQRKRNAFLRLLREIKLIWLQNLPESTAARSAESEFVRERLAVHTRELVGVLQLAAGVLQGCGERVVFRERTPLAPDGKRDAGVFRHELAGRVLGVAADRVGKQDGAVPGAAEDAEMLDLALAQ